MEDSPSRKIESGLEDIIFKPKRRAFPLFFLLLIFLIASILGGAYVVWSNSKPLDSTISPTPQATQNFPVPDSQSEAEARLLTERVAKLIVLPSNEIPTVATVTDVNKLKDQPFFEKAINGDKVLIFTQAKKAVLYRPSTDQVIDVAPINVAQ